jgi:DNA polymerase-3 subunit epsilon
MPATIPVHALDFEGGARTGVVEYGVATFLNGEITSTRTRLCAATAPIPRVDTQCHGLRDADVAGAAPFSDEWELFSNLRRAGLFCAHHAPTELFLLKTVWPYPGAMPDHARPGEALNDWGPWVDTHRLALAWHPGLPDYKLEELIRHFGLQEELHALARQHCPPGRARYHCALFDALASAVLLRHFLATPSGAATTLERLICDSSGTARRSARQQTSLDLCLF